MLLYLKQLENNNGKHKVLKIHSNNKNVDARSPSVKQNCSVQDVLKCRTAIAFFIGGAGDKETYYTTGPFKNVEEAMDLFDPKLSDLISKYSYTSIYLGYNEVRGYENINKNVIAKIPSRTTSIFIVGHSLGGWNGAHLSEILNNKNFKVEMLVTLDPVGEGVLVWVGSNIHRGTPKPKTNFWINILAKPSSPDSSDRVADFGERWIVDKGPNINHIADIHHYNARGLFFCPLAGGKTAADIMHDSIRSLVAA